jgi:homoserine O-acetyltransferase
MSNSSPLHLDMVDARTFLGETGLSLASLVNAQKYALLDRFELENGSVLENVSVGYKTWGSLNANKDNVMVICHALTGSSDAEDW